MPMCLRAARSAVSLALVCGAFAISGVAAQGPLPETRLKSAFIYRFTDYVEWPADALANRKAIDVCLVRPDPFGQELATLVAGQTLAGREFAIRELEADEAIDACHVLVIPAQASKSGRAMLQKAAGHPILTIGDYDTFLDDGGTIGLRVVDGRIRFEVALAAAQKAGIRLSSQLLRLALRVR